MLYLVSPAKYPLYLIISGKLITDDGFIHPNRTLNVFVLIYVLEGTLHIAQNDKTYDIGSNQFITLFAGQNHYGYKHSNGPVSYFWVHFSFANDNYYFYDYPTLQATIRRQNADSDHTDEIYLLPEISTITLNKRVEILFSQLLDITRQTNFAPKYYNNYALSTLMLEIANQHLACFSSQQTQIPPIVTKVMDWIKSKYIYPITVTSIAEAFNYNPRYLSSLFKKYSGESLLSWLNNVRIEIAKNTLVSSNISIKEVAWSSGFQDEKYFLKLFKKKEGMTPSEYRNAFFSKKLNNDIVP